MHFIKKNKRLVKFGNYTYREKYRISRELFFIGNFFSGSSYFSDMYFIRVKNGMFNIQSYYIF